MFEEIMLMIAQQDIYDKISDHAWKILSMLISIAVALWVLNMFLPV